MSQHFLLSAKARMLSVLKVMQMNDTEAFTVFKELRWGAGDMVSCPCCGVIGKHAFRRDRNGFGYGLLKSTDTTRTLSARYYKDGSEILIDRGFNPDKPPFGKANLKNHPRRLTPLECARLMGYNRPGQSDFRIPVSDTQAYKQFGNSVVVPVFAAVAKLMKPKILEAKKRAAVNLKKAA